MRKEMSLLLSSILLIFLLASCGKNATSEEVKKLETTEESNVPTKEEPKEQRTLSIEEVKVIIDDLVDNILTVYIDAGIKYNLDDQNVTDDIYQSMAKDFQPFATEQLINTHLFEIAKVFCYDGCDISYFPDSTKYSLRFKLLESTSNKLIIEYIFPDDELLGHSTEQVTLKKVDGTWKLDDYSFSNVSLNLTKEEAIEIIEIKALSGYQFDKEAQLEDPNKGMRKVYVFKSSSNLNENEQLVIFADTGYNYILPEGTLLVSSTDDSDTAPSSQKEEYLQMLNNLNNELAYIDELYDEKAVVEMRDLEERRYQSWDTALNDIYGILKEQLSTSEMEALRQEQREWIVYRDTTAENGTEQLGGGWQSLQYTINLKDITKDRCYELVNLYMK